MNFTCAAICASGLVRSENQDNLYVDGVYRKDISDNSDFRYDDAISSSGLFAVADGMGGEKHGELASLVTVQAMDGIDRSNVCRSMAQYLTERNAVICDLINEHGGGRIGSTFAGLYIDGKNAEIINIGDSRIYLFRDSSLKQLSRDHTPIRQMIEMGILTEASARNHPDRHKLTQHLGIFPSETIIEPYTACVDVHKKDIYLLCSDGLTDMLDDPQIESILMPAETIQEKTEKLYSSALSRGGKDNITVLLVQAG